MLHPKGAVGVVVRSPGNPAGSYRVPFLDGVGDRLAKDEIVSLASYKEGRIGDTGIVAKHANLYDRAGLPYIPELIDRKQSGSEKERPSQVDLALHQREYDRLREELQQAFETSSLPDTPRGAEALHALLVRLRLKERQMPFCAN